jgi:NADH:ubiquinone reductase (H+-translocating)
MSGGDKKRILILGGGFAGLYAAMHLDRGLARRADIEVTLVNRENFFLFTPMLHEVAASDLTMTNIVSPVRQLLRHVNFFAGEVESVDLASRKVVVSHGSDNHRHALDYDHLVFGLGCVTNFYNLPGLAERAMTMKSLGDAVHLRNRLIALLEEADSECCSNIRKPLLTFVVAGGGFAGVETVAALNDFVRQAMPFYLNLRKEMLRVVLVHSGEVILPELNDSLGRYAQKKLAERGVEIKVKTKVSSVSDSGVELSNGESIPTRAVIWTAGTSPNPVLNDLPCSKEMGRLRVNETLQVVGHSGLWAVGDCALVPNWQKGGYHPTTAQHALRQGKVLAKNLIASVRGEKLERFSFTTLGQLAAIGRRTGVANILGVNFSGFVAWWLWRTIYLSKLPRLEKKVRVALDWTLDLLFTKDLVQFNTFRSQAISTRERSQGAAG